MLILSIIALFLLVDIIFVIWLSCKHKVNPFNFRELMKAWKKEFN